MKKNKRKSILSKQTTAKRRVAYSLAAGAAALSGARPAEAEVVYSGLQNESVAQGSALQLDVDDFGGWDVLLKNYVFGGGNYQGATVRYAPGQLVGFSSISNGYAYVTALSAHDVIDSTTVGPSFFGSMAYGGANPSAQFNSVSNAFVGFSFLSGSQLTYGWARVDVDNSAGTLVVKDWAYDAPALEGGSASGDAPLLGGILAGDTGNGFVPEPGTLGMLAIGATGLLGLRRRRKPAA
jgi:PEP-CTERM motif